MLDLQNRNHAGENWKREAPETEKEKKAQYIPLCMIFPGTSAEDPVLIQDLGLITQIVGGFFLAHSADSVKSLFVTVL